MSFKIGFPLASVATSPSPSAMSCVDCNALLRVWSEDGAIPAPPHAFEALPLQVAAQAESDVLTVGPAESWQLPQAMLSRSTVFRVL